MSADVDALAALDRGVIDAGLSAAEALARCERLEARLAAIFAYMREETQSAGLAPPPKAAPARHLRVVR